MEITIGKQEIMISRRKLYNRNEPVIRQQQPPSSIEIILSFGFTRSGSCNCGGTRNEIYQKDGYYLYLRKTRFLFKIKKKNEVIVPISPLAKLETELKKLFPNAVALAEEKV